MSEDELRRFLGRAHHIKQDLRALNRRMLELRSRTLPGSPKFSEVPPAPGDPVSGGFVRYSDEIIMMLEDAEDRARQLVKVEKEIEDTIYLLAESVERSVLYDYYINDLPIVSSNPDRISLEKEYHYSERYIKYLLHKGRIGILSLI